jgi:hypothetical protein
MQMSGQKEPMSEIQRELKLQDI